MNIRSFVVSFALGFALTARGEPPAPAPVHVGPEETIAFYEKKLEAHPTLFAGWAAVGAAYLDEARETHDVTWLAKARAALSRSIEIQPSASALATMAALCNFSHRFACGLEYAERASRANPRDAGPVTQKVEAYLGLGQLDAAAALLDARERSDGESFGLLAARGRWFAEQQRFDEALASFAAAAAQAQPLASNDLTIWAETNAAGMLLDSHRPALARPHLDAASQLKTSSWPTQAVLLVHWAELDDLEGHADRALGRYLSILERQQDPEMYRRAFVLTKKLGREAEAQRLFAAGERAAQRIADAGEIFALEAQARLYADAGVKLERAQQLAEHNLTQKRDRSARETLAYVRERLAASP